MANPAPNLVAPDVAERQEFWKPMVAPRLEVAPAGEAPTTACGHCGGSLAGDSRLCPTCGADSQASNASLDTSTRWDATWPELAALRRWLGRATSSLVALVLGCACIVAAVITGFVFNATTLVDWQAIQLWRIEWLLAAIAILLAGILLKKK
jgi:hypothetical protein